jgi:hypothetical protein
MLPQQIELVQYCPSVARIVSTYIRVRGLGLGEGKKTDFHNLDNSDD